MKIASLSKLVLIFFFFFFAFLLSFTQHLNLLLPDHKFIAQVKSYNYLVMFVAFNFIVIAIFLASSFSKASSMEFDLISNYLPPLQYELVVCEGEIATIDHERDKKSNDLIFSPFFNAEIKEEILVNTDETCGDESDGGFHGYDGYDEDNEDGDGGSEDGYDSDQYEKVEDLERKIEEFIAKNNKKWKEEKQNDKLFHVHIKR